MEKSLLYGLRVSLSVTRRCDWLSSVLANRALQASLLRPLSVSSTPQQNRCQSSKSWRTSSRVGKARSRMLERFRNSQHALREAKDMMRENVMTVPNLLCITRIGLTPYIGYLIIQEDFRLACWITAFAGFTDLMDGIIARSFPSQRSMAGSYLDPLADKILVTTLCLSLTFVGLIPVPLTALIVLRDVLLIGAACVVRYRSIPPPRTIGRYFDPTFATANISPTRISKYNTGIQLAMVIISLGAPVLNYVDHPNLHLLWYLTAASTIAAGLSYIFQKGTYQYFLSKGVRRRRN